jgi:hypothetical protein
MEIILKKEEILADDMTTVDGRLSKKKQVACSQGFLYL